MPFKSQAQRRKFYAMAARGEISRKKVQEWESHTPKGKLPEKVAAAFVDEVIKIAFGVSAYSGPLGYGGFKQESYIPPFMSPPVKTAGPPPPKKKAKTAASRTPVGPADLPPPRGAYTSPPPRKPKSAKPAGASKPARSKPTGTRSRGHFMRGDSAAAAKKIPWKYVVPGLVALGGLTAGAHYLDKQAVALTPMGQLRSTQRIGRPKVTAPPGPSIADVSKPHGFGKPLPGAAKNKI